MEKNLEISDASLIKVVSNILNPTVGTHFWVDGSTGVDTNSGLTPSAPRLTITSALSLCTAGAFDVIHVLANSPSAPPATETFPINVNKAGVTIRGEHGSGLLSDSGFGSDAQNVATLLIAANYVTIENLYLGCDNLGTTGGIVQFTGSTFACTLRNILFDTQYVPAYGVYTTGDQPYLLIEDCVFGRYDVAGYTTAGIYIFHSTAGMIRRNVFRACAGIAISAGASAGNFDILDNRFCMPSDTDGKAITLAAGSSGIYVDGNHANFGSSDATDPYRDVNGDDSNTWGLNYKGITATMPKLT